MITFELTTAPEAEALAVKKSEARSQCRVVCVDDDEVIFGYVRAAQAQLDGEEGLLGRCLLTQTWKMRLDGWPGYRWNGQAGSGFPYLDRPTARLDWNTGILRVPLAPIQSIGAITYVDENNATQTLSAAALDIETVGDFARIQPSLAAAWPNLSATALAPVSVVFTAGYGAAADIPRPIVQAILLKTARWFDHRFAEFEADGWSQQELALLTPYRLRNSWRV